uniref:Uncharacterized protein LOC105114872 n=1 Tax=Rhizophora mucronata TaxID=61149 RepID=A0A2P2IPL7_RHIMU
MGKRRGSGPVWGTG